MQPTNDSRYVMAAGKIPLSQPDPLPDRATPFGVVTPTVPHWPGKAEPPEGDVAAPAVAPDRD